MCHQRLASCTFLRCLRLRLATDFSRSRRTWASSRAAAARSSSKDGIYFRRWANSVLKQHLVDGYTINRKRLDALHAVIKVLSRSTEPEIAGTAEILERYLPSLVLLNDYDTGNVPIPKGDESQWVLTYEDAMLFIRSMPYMPITVVFANSFAHGAENAYIWLFAVCGGACMG